MKKIVVGIFLLQILFTPMAFAQILQMDLSIFGMDCAICAHGVQSTLLKIEGVQKVEISLEKGLAHIEFKPDNKVLLTQIENAVRRNGFSPKGGTVELRGRIQNSQVTVTGSNETVSSISNSGTTDPQKDYVIHGTLKIDDKGTKSLSITSAN
jgi:copper chaperone CopZ